MQICDVIPVDTNFVSDAFDLDRGIAIFNTDPLVDPPQPTFLTNRVNDGDSGNFYDIFTQTPNVCKNNPQAPQASQVPLTAANNNNGAVVVNVVSASNGTELPPATGAGNPANSYGFIRFKVQVK